MNEPGKSLLQSTDQPQASVKRRATSGPEYLPTRIGAVALATYWTVVTLSLGLFSFGGWTTLVSSFGFVGGLLLWLTMPTRG